MQKTNALMVMVIFEWEKMFFMVKHFEIWAFNEVLSKLTAQQILGVHSSVKRLE